MNFFEEMQQASEPYWTDSVTHRFVKEIGSGTVPPQVMANYLVQDHRFIDVFLSLLGASMSYADKFESRIVLGRFIGMISNDENDYFLRSFEELNVSVRDRQEPKDNEATTGLKNIMSEAARSGSYAASISVLAVAEGIYLDWAQRISKPYPLSFVHREWIELHDNPYFVDFVTFLKEELNRVGPANQASCHSFFTRTVKLEKLFFDSAYVAV